MGIFGGEKMDTSIEAFNKEQERLDYLEGLYWHEGKASRIACAKEKMAEIIKKKSGRRNCFK
jgi:hypothetical protein